MHKKLTLWHKLALVKNTHTHKPKPNLTPKPTVHLKNCSCKSAYDWAQLWYTVQHRTVLIIFPLKMTITCSNCMIICHAHCSQQMQKSWQIAYQFSLLHKTELKDDEKRQKSKQMCVWIPLQFHECWLISCVCYCVYNMNYIVCNVELQSINCTYYVDSFWFTVV